MKSTIILILAIILISCKQDVNKDHSESIFYTDSLYSKSLQEYRKHNIYLPANFSLDKNYPIIYSTDGAISLDKSYYRKSLDSLIFHNIIEPVIYISAHSNSKIADSTSATTGDGKKVYLQYRNLEYVEIYSSGNIDSNLDNRFKNHMSYFSEELIPKMEEKFNPKATKNSRLFYGVSNGAGFGANLLNKRPELIGTYICFSTLGSHVEKNEWKKSTNYPDLYLAYGDEESFIFREEAEMLKEKYEISNSFCDLQKYNGGHDYNKWNEEFTKIISQILAKK